MGLMDEALSDKRRSHALIGAEVSVAASTAVNSEAPPEQRRGKIFGGGQPMQSRDNHDRTLKYSSTSELVLVDKYGFRDKVDATAKRERHGIRHNLGTAVGRTRLQQHW
jgi:hypothetical protein